jgi:predicted DNA-binding transcriptional regulator YafY
MAGNPDQKLKLLYLLKILYENTDEDHPMDISGIISELFKVGITAERKSLYSDMRLLQHFGIDVIKKKTKTFGYFVGRRDFEVAELKLLVDAVQAAKFITRKKSVELIGKIEKLTDRFQAKQLQRQVYVEERNKALNEQIYYNVDKLHSAISQKKQVSFKYFEYNIDKIKQPRNNGEAYIVCPYALIWIDDNYYLVSYYPKHVNEITHFRVDKMENIDILDCGCIDFNAVPAFKDLKIAGYSKKLFGMFYGVTLKARIQFENSLINAVIDKFGEDVNILKNSETTFTARVEVADAPTFLGWLVQFGEKVRILSPDTLVVKMNELLEKTIAVYRQEEMER